MSLVLVFQGGGRGGGRVLVRQGGKGGVGGSIFKRQPLGGQARIYLTDGERR